MSRVARIGPVWLAVAALVLTAAVVAGVWLGLRDGGSDRLDRLDRRTYLADVSAACSVYARRLARIGAPGDVAAYGDVIEAVGAVVPLLQKQSSAMQAFRPPAELEARLERLYALDDRSIAALEGALVAARRREAGGVAKGLAGFAELRDRIHAQSAAVGIHCDAARPAPT